MKAATKLLIDSQVFRRKAMKLPLDSSPGGFSGRMFDIAPEEPKPNIEPKPNLHALQDNDPGYLISGLEQLKNDIETFKMSGEQISSKYENALKLTQNALSKAGALVRSPEHNQADLQHLQYTDSILFNLYKLLIDGSYVRTIDGIKSIIKALRVYGPVFHDFVELKLPYMTSNNNWQKFFTEHSAKLQNDADEKYDNNSSK